MYRNFMTNDAQQSVLNFVVSQQSIIEPTVYRLRYPDIQYPRLVPVDTSGNEWAKSITFFSQDMVGKADWFHHMALDVPLADITREKFEQGMEMAAIGYHYTLEELAQAMSVPGLNLSADRATAARRAYDEFVDAIAMRGNTVKNWFGLINNPGVTIANAAATGNGGSPAWIDKDSDQVMEDINVALTGLYTESLTVEMADTILLPITAFASLGTRRIPNTTSNILEYLARNNTYTNMTGQPLTIRAVRGLETAGAGSTGRMVVYRNDPQVLKLHLPMPHRFLSVWQRGPLRYDVPGIFRLGPLEIRLPKAVRYVDGVVEAPYE